MMLAVIQHKHAWGYLDDFALQFCAITSQQIDSFETWQTFSEGSDRSPYTEHVLNIKVKFKMHYYFIL